ncbi:MAG: TIGR04282 family arsenosugar biosynthesis glycosyltransferase [Ferruginibacter sp.]
MDKAVIIFVKNPVAGKVKTRLAASVGDEKALDIYLQLVYHTMEEIKNTEADKYIFFSDAIDEGVANQLPGAYCKVQHGVDLGERMLNAFATIFSKGYKKVVIIGTDCPDITSELLDKAFSILNKTNVVFGPAIDGGYYLLGMQKLITDLFFHISWSTNSVLEQSISICESLNKTYDLLQILSDVDEEKDLFHFYKILKKKVA